MQGVSRKAMGGEIARLQSGALGALGALAALDGIGLATQTIFCRWLSLAVAGCRWLSLAVALNALWQRGWSPPRRHRGLNRLWPYGSNQQSATRNESFDLSNMAAASTDHSMKPSTSLALGLDGKSRGN